MLSEALTEEEIDFLRGSDGGITGIFADILDLDPTDPNISPKRAAEAAAQQALRSMAESYPNRAQRLLVFASIADASKQARDALLAEIIDQCLSTPTKRERDGVWCGMALQPWEEDWLARASRLTKQTISKWVRKAYWAKLRAAMIEAGDDPATLGL